MHLIFLDGSSRMASGAYNIHHIMWAMTRPTRTGRLCLGLQQVGATTWLRSRKCDGCARRRIGLFGEPRGRHMSNSERATPVIMMMMIDTKCFFRGT